MSNLEIDHNYVPEELVNQLVKGYDALRAEIKILDEQRRELENRVSWAKQQVCVRLFFCIAKILYRSSNDEYH
jgi:hypothetical protein